MDLGESCSWIIELYIGCISKNLMLRILTEKKHLKNRFDIIIIINFQMFPFLTFLWS